MHYDVYGMTNGAMTKVAELDTSDGTDAAGNAVISWSMSGAGQSFTGWFTNADGKSRMVLAGGQLYGLAKGFGPTASTFDIATSDKGLLKCVPAGEAFEAEKPPQRPGQSMLPFLLGKSYQASTPNHPAETLSFGSGQKVFPIGNTGSQMILYTWSLGKEHGYMTEREGVVTMMSSARKNIGLLSNVSPDASRFTFEMTSKGIIYDCVPAKPAKEASPTGVSRMSENQITWLRRFCKIGPATLT